MLRDAATVAVGSGAAQALTVLVAPVLTRLYTPAEVGAAVVLMGAMAFVAAIACLRFDLAIPIASGDRAVAELCAVCLVAVAAVSAVLAGVAARFGPALCDAAGVPQMAPYVWLVPLHAAVAGVGLVGVGLLIRRRRYARLAATRFSQAAGQSATQVGAGVAGGGAAWFAGGVTAGAAAYTLAAVAAARPRLEQFAGALRGAPAAARRWARFAAWSGGGATLSIASLVVPAILVTALYGPARGGLFVLAARVVGLPVTLATEAIGQAWFGTAAEIVREGRGNLAAALAGVTRTLLLGGGAVLVVVLVVGPFLFGPIFGDAWRDAGDLMLALAPLYLSILVAAPAGQALQALGRTDLLAVVAAGRLAAPIAGIAGGHALGWSLTASLGLYAAAMVAVSAVNAAFAWRVTRAVG